MTDQKLPDVDTPHSEADSVRSLRAALTVVRTREADRGDAADEAREAEREQLESLAEKLRPLLDEVDARDERFELVLSSGSRPRLWIDMTAFVVIGPLREGKTGRCYRLLRDTRLGRVVLSETPDANAAADAVTAYMAERIVEREKMLEGDWLAATTLGATAVPTSAQPADTGEKPPVITAATTVGNAPDEIAEPEAEEAVHQPAEAREPKKRRSRWFLFVLLGLLVGAVAAAAWFYSAVSGAL